MTRVLLLVLVLAAVSGASLWLITRQPATNLPVYWSVPDFTLVAASGKPFSRSDVAGNVWVADFIFTHCAGTCPVMSVQMARVDQELAKRLGATPPVRLVSISVDPDRDTPAVLDDYSRKFGASERWSFLTGEREKIIELTKGFKLASGEEPSNEIVHSSKLVLVDRQNRIRGFYDGVEQASVDQLIADATALARERVP